MKFFQKIKRLWDKIRKYWSSRFLIMFRNEKNLSIVFTLKLTPRKIFVFGTTIFLIIIMLTAMLIAFTPLRVYVPGYTNPIEYQLYKRMLTRVDSIERINAVQKVYMDNFYNVLNDIVFFEEMDAPEQSVAEKRVQDKNKTEDAKKQMHEAVEQILTEIADRSAKSYIPISYQHISTPTFAFNMPALGVITQTFSIEERHFGIDIENERSALVTAIADGVVISLEVSEKEGNTILIQHSGNMVSIYRNVDIIYRKECAKVKSGDPIATMGKGKTESQNPYLHFELWYNGTPVNPLNYFVGN
jgi:hypothetical protein